jgi:hypothetical protein
MPECRHDGRDVLEKARRYPSFDLRLHHEVTRRACGMELLEFGVPMDVLWDGSIMAGCLIPIDLSE